MFAYRSLSPATSLVCWMTKSKNLCSWLEHWFACHLSCLHREQRSPWCYKNIVFLAKRFHLIKNCHLPMSTIASLWYCTVNSVWLVSALKIKKIWSLLLTGFNHNKQKMLSHSRSIHNAVCLEYNVEYIVYILYLNVMCTFLWPPGFFLVSSPSL